MEIGYYILTLLLVISSVLPFIEHQYWIFRIFDFVRIQICVLQIVLVTLGFIFIARQDAAFWIAQFLLLICIVYNVTILMPYTQFYTKRNGNISSDTSGSRSISVLSVNVHQFNTQFQRLIDLVHEVHPDILFTMESNKDWEEALSVLDDEFFHYKKIALENTYGMHFYTKLKVNKFRVHYFMADDLPSIEADLETSDQSEFVFFGVHPPPPSPTEEVTSKERDGELLAVAKRIRKLSKPVLVVGDFNNVAWARASVLFRKTSRLIDSRMGRGFIATFHANYKWLRFPIDLLFHSTHIFIEELKTLTPIGSDHLPMYCRFSIDHTSERHNNAVEHLKKEELAKVNELIKRGEEETSNNRAPVAEE